MKTTRMLVIAMCIMAMLAGTSSCKKEKSKTEGEEMYIEATIGGADGNSKTHLDGPHVIWDSRDAFQLYSGTKGESFIISPKEAGASTATFIGFNPGAAPYYACYPSNATRTEDGFTFMVVADQSGNMADISTVNAGPMVAYYTGEDNLKFKNAMSWLNIGLKGNAVVKKMVLTDKSAGAMLNGKMTVKMDENAITQWTMAEGTNTLFIESDGIQLHDGTTDDVYTWFRFFVPVNSFKGTDAVEIKVYGADPSTPIKTYTKTLQHNGVQGVEENMIYSPKISESIHFTAPTVTLTDGCLNCKQVINGKVTVSGPAQYCEYGIVYSKTEAQPEIGKPGCMKLMTNAESITGNRDFSVDLAPLNDGPYYVRTYVIANASAYSSDVAIFDTPKPLPSTWTNGKNPHPFTVGSGKMVYFSQGNLQYNATGSSSSATSGANVGGTWRFAEHQFDLIGTDNKNIAQTYTGWIDLFCWATSGYNHNNKCYQPWSSSTDGDANYYAFGEAWTDISGKADWGYNAISNGGNTENSGWRTMKIAEWNYLMTRSGKSAWGKVGCTCGVILLPEDFSWSDPSLSGAGLPYWFSGPQDWNKRNNYTYSQWSLIEALGAVFIPATGYRNGTALQDVNSKGRYWTSEDYNVDGAHKAYFYNNGYEGNTGGHLYFGFPVRLVRNAN